MHEVSSSQASARNDPVRSRGVGDGFASEQVESVTTEGSDVAQAGGVLIPTQVFTPLRRVSASQFLGIQRLAGNQAALTMVQGRLSLRVQRDGPQSGAPTATDPQPDQAKQEQEQKAWDAARTLEGQPAIKVLFSSPVGNKQPPDSELFTIDRLEERPTATPKRLGFDSQGAAAAYATMRAGATGAVVLKHDEFYFVAHLAKGEHELRGIDESKNDVSRLSAFVDWFKTRDFVYRVDPASGSNVVSAVARDGFTFPLGHDLTPESQAGVYSPDPTGAQGMRAMAGIMPEGTKPGQVPQMPDTITIPPDQQDAFIIQYTRARAQEALAENDKRVTELKQTFTATSPDGKPSPEAKAQIDAARQLGTQYRTILEQEAKLRPLVSNMDAAAQEPVPFSSNEYTIEVDGRPQTKTVQDWAADLDKQLGDVEHGKLQMLAKAPLLAQLAGGDEPSAWDQSLLAKPPSEETDASIRAEFTKKLEAVSQAIFRAKTETAGESIRFLFGMEGLRERVRADFARMSGPNAGLKDRLNQMLYQFAVDNIRWDFLGQAIQVGLLFVPGGQVIAAVAGFAMAADQMNEAAERYNISQASVDPAHALVAEQQAVVEVASATINLAIAAVTLAMAINAASQGKAPPAPPGGGGGSGGGKPTFRTLDPARYTPVGEPSWGTSESTILQDTQTQERFLFKPSEGEAQVPRAQGVGINQGDYARRAVAATRVADAMGIQTPEVELVSWNGREGSLQKWFNAQTLADIKFNDPVLYDKVINSAEFKRLKADMDAFDYILTNIDRGNNEANFLVEFDRGGKVDKLIPIDNELAFPPSPERAVLRGEAPALPDRVSRAAYQHLQDGHADPDKLRGALKSYLTDPEIEGALRRNDQLLSSIDDKLARLGPPGAFTDP
jgi:hypothetical protein